MIKQQHLNLTPIIRINDTSPRINEVLRRQTRTRGYPSIYTKGQQQD